MRSDKGKNHNYPKNRKLKGIKKPAKLKSFEKARNIINTLFTNVKTIYQENKNSLVKHFGRMANQQLKRGKDLLAQAEKYMQTFNGRVSEKVLTLYKDWFTFNTYTDVTAQRPTQYANFQMMILEKLKNAGVDIYNPSELNKVLHGMSVEEISNLWSNLDELDEGDTVVKTAYYVFKDDPVSFLNRLSHYRNKQRMSEKKQREALIALGINPA